ncbi:hypothetical protein A2U01_0063359, partial [Trifolium medium]|nr:hypothetical protein [Trifolium medium]
MSLVSPLKERKDSSDSDDELPASEAKDTTGTEGASDAQVSKGKEPTVSDTAIVGTTTATTPKRKRADKEKTEKVVEGKK